MSKKDKPELSLVPQDTNLEDPLEILELLKDAILNRDYDKHNVASALKQTLDKYETKNRIFLIAAANAELPRIVRLLQFINTCEEEMFKTDRIEGASTKDLIRMYALSQSNLMTGLDNVKKVADMRLEFLRAGAGEGGIGSLFDEDKNMSALADLPGLDARNRDKVRNTVQGLLDSIEKDESLGYSEEDDGESTSDDSTD